MFYLLAQARAASALRLRRAKGQSATCGAQPNSNLRHTNHPSSWLSGRMSVGVQSDPTELAATQTATWPSGPRAGVPLVRAQEWPFV
jgi:hypothetical protein